MATFGLAQNESRAQRPQFGVLVARVRADVVVTDGDGRFVDDFTADDFLLYEDGVPH